MGFAEHADAAALCRSSTGAVMSWKCALQAARMPYTCGNVICQDISNTVIKKNPRNADELSSVYSIFKRLNN
jgi:hypothetical protein